MIQAEGEAQTKVQNDLLAIELTFEKESPLLPELHAEMQQEAATALGKAKETPERRGSNKSLTPPPREPRVKE